MAEYSKDVVKKKNKYKKVQLVLQVCVVVCILVVCCTVKMQLQRDGGCPAGNRSRAADIIMILGRRLTYHLIVPRHALSAPY